MRLRADIVAVVAAIVGGICAPIRSQPPRPFDVPPSAALPYTSGPTLLRLPATAARNHVAPLETLEAAWAIAVAVDQQLEAIRWGVSSAEQSLLTAEAQRWPTFTTGASYTVRSAESAFLLNASGLPLPSNRFRTAQQEGPALHAAIDLPLFTGGRIQHGVDAAAADVTSAQLEVERGANDLRLRVAEEYLAVLRAQRDHEMTQSTLRSLEAHARDVAMLFKHQRVPRNDLLAAEVALANARQQVIRSTNVLDAARATYNRRLGRALTTPVRIAPLQQQAVTDDVQTLTYRALQNRPEIARLAMQVSAMRHEAASLSAGNTPQFQLQSEYAFEENRFRSPEGIASVGLGVSWNLFDGGRVRHRAAALSWRAEALLRMRADLQSRIALQVRKAWLDVHQTCRRLEVTPQACSQADENLRVAKFRYSRGAGTNTEVLDAETLRTESYRNHDNATYDAVLAVARLRHAVGSLGRGGTGNPPSDWASFRQDR